MSSYVGSGSWRIGPEREWCLLSEDEMNAWGDWMVDYMDYLIDTKQERTSWSWDTAKLLEENRTPQPPGQQERVV